MSEFMFDLQLFTTAVPVSNPAAAAVDSYKKDSTYFDQETGKVKEVAFAGSGATQDTASGAYTLTKGATGVVAGAGVSLTTEDGVGDINVTVIGGGANIVANAGNNTILVIGDDAVVATGSGDDAVYIGSSNASVEAGDGNNTIAIGSATDTGANATVTAGSGNDSISVYNSDAHVNAGDGNNSVYVQGDYAEIITGAGNDAITLVNSTDSTIDAGAGTNNVVLNSVTSSSVTFGDGKTTITGLGAYNPNGTYNVVETSNTDLYGNVTTDGSNLSLKDADGNRLYLRNITTDTAFAWNDGNSEQVIKVGATKANNSFTYDENFTQYWGGSKSDSLVASKTSDNVSVWLDGTNVLTNESTNVSYTSMDVVDLSKVSGNVTLAGTANSETLIGGTGGGSIWGGFGDGDDLLVAGKKSTLTLVGGMGQGNDTMTAYSTNTIKLWNVNVSDVTSFDKGDANTIVLGFSDGKTLTVGLMESSGTYTFEAANGEQWQSKYDSSTKTRSWSKV